MFLPEQGTWQSNCGECNEFFLSIMEELHLLLSSSLSRSWIFCSILLLYPKIEALSKDVLKSLIHLGSSVTQRVYPKPMQAKSRKWTDSARITISCLLFVEGTLQFHHTWPAPVCLCNLQNIWKLFQLTASISSFWLMFSGNHSLSTAGWLSLLWPFSSKTDPWVTAYAGFLAEPRFTKKEPKVVWSDVPPAFLSLQYFLFHFSCTYHHIVVL